MAADFVGSDEDGEASVGWPDLWAAALRRLPWLLLAPLVAGALGFGASFLIRPTFVSTTSFLPPQPAQTGLSSALAALGPLAGLAGAAGVRTPSDQYVALMQSTTVSDRIIDAFQLVAVYEAKFRIDARRELARNVRINAGRKEGLISIEVEDESPQRAADIANRYIEELRRLTSGLAITEAQQRRIFFERQLQATRDALAKAQLSLQASGFNPGALKAEPKAAAEGYARLRAEATAAEVRLRTLRERLADSTPEVQQQLALLAALRGQMARAEQPSGQAEDADYVGRYREFKYQEALFEVYARQFELARVDESREGALIQVVDVAAPAERKFKPKRAFIAAMAAVVALLATLAWIRVEAGRRARGARGQG